MNDAVKADETPENSHRLGYEDYEITSIRYTFDIRGAVWNEDQLKFITSLPQYDENNSMYCYAKFGADDNWTLAGIYHFTDRRSEILSDKVKSFNGSNLVFARNAQCTGYKFVISNSFFSTIIKAYPQCKIKHSELVDQIIDESYRAGERKIWLTNRATGIVNGSTPDEVSESNEIFKKTEVARDIILGYQSHSYLSKSNTFVDNNKIKRTVTIGWSSQLSETYTENGDTLYIPQQSGIFYDLLPEGGQVDFDTIDVFANGTALRESQYDISTVTNYKNSGRTMLIVKIKHSTDTVYTLKYSTVHSWQSFIDYGDNIRNSIAYQTGNKFISDGYEDDGGDIIDAALMKELDVSATGSKFLYRELTIRPNILLAVSSGLSKKVKSADESTYTKSSIVHQNQIYTYYMRYATDYAAKAKNIVLLDNLESYSNSANNIEGQWRGTLQSIDVSQMARLGAAPVVYLSADFAGTESITPEDLANSSQWKRMESFGDISKAKAIAIDASKNTSGGEFILGSSQSIAAIVYMKSPSSEPDAELSDGQVAAQVYNDINASSQLSSILEDNFIEDKIIKWGYTATQFRIMADIPILKVDERDHTTPVSGISFLLEGTSEYGTPVRILKESDVNGYITFKNIEKGSYRLIEYEGSDDYQKIDGIIMVTVNQDGTVTVDDEPLEDGVRYIISDKPRIHANISFNKKNYLRKNFVIEGVKFRLYGTSEYGNEVNQYAVSDENGIVTFRNIELGSYSMNEVSAVQGFMISAETYRVRVDDNGNFSISGSVMEKDGTLTLYNTPLQTITIQKEGYIQSGGSGRPVAGAVFNLSGTSDRGTAVNLTRTTQSNGRAVFSNLEAGSYVLYEVSAPEGYICDSTRRLTKIGADGSITIEGLTKNDDGNFVVKNKEDSNITITKKWVDNETNDSRTTEPYIHLDIDDDSPAVYWYGRTGNWLDTSSTPLTRVTSLSNIQKFVHYTDDDEEAVRELIDNGTAKRMDDGSTQYVIYAWYISDSQADDYGTVYWWSDSPKVYLTDKSRSIWSNLQNCTYIDFSGIDTSMLTDMSYMFYYTNKLQSFDLSSFDTSNVTNMRYMFQTYEWNSNAYTLTSIDLTGWDTSAVTDMSYMFYGRRGLRTIEGISGFNTSRVTRMDNMFYYCQSLSQLDVSGWDTSSVTDMQNMFYQCYNLQALDVSAWDVSGVTNMQYMFYNCYNLKELDVSAWNTSKVTSMYQLFYNCNKLTELDVSAWDTSSVTNMYGVFYYCYGLTELDVSTWDTSSVTNMYGVFYYCYGLTELDVSEWDTSNVTDIGYMFSSCNKLTELDVSRWNTSKVTNMSGVFSSCTALQDLDLHTWDTSSVTNMESMFYNSGLNMSSFYKLSNWNVSNVTNMNSIFSSCKNLTELGFIVNWDLSNLPGRYYMFASSGLNDLSAIADWDLSYVTSIAGLFNGCNSLTDISPLTNWNTSGITNMEAVFANCQELTDISPTRGWNTANVTTMNSMFYNCQKLEDISPVSGWNISSVQNLSSMFSQCYKLSDISPLSNWNTGNVTSMSRLFYNCSILDDITPLINWDTSNVTDMSSLFSNCYKLSDIAPLADWNTDNVTSMSSMFYNCSRLTDVSPLSNWNTSNVTSLYEIFRYCSGLISISGLSNWDTSNVTSLGYTFYGCNKLTSISPLTNWKTSKVTNMGYTFASCSQLTSLEALRNWDVSNATNMQYMFSSCSGVTSLEPLSAWNISKVNYIDNLFISCSGLTSLEGLENWNTGRVTRMSQMFYGCSKITSLEPLRNWDISNNYYMNGMFAYCSLLTDTEPIKNWNTSRVQNMYSMFEGCRALVNADLSNWSTSSVTQTYNMFYYCNNLVSIIVSDKWNMNNVTSSGNMFYYCIALNSDGAATPYSSSFTDKTYARIGTDATPGYLRLTTSDDDVNPARPADPSTPISGSTASAPDASKRAAKAYFRYSGYDWSPSAALSVVTSTSNIKEFRHFTGEYAEVEPLISGGQAVRLDDNSTAGVIYAWYISNSSASDYGTVYWWSNAEKVCLRYNYTLWVSLTNCTYIDVSGIDTSELTSMKYMFYDCNNLTTIAGAGSWDTSHVTNMSYMFYRCHKITNLGFMRNWDLSRVTTTEYMFSNCNFTSLDDVGLADWDVSELKAMNYMFYYCQQLTDISALSGWNTGNVTNMQGMFYYCNNVSSIEPLRNWNTGKVTSMGWMFYYCQSLLSLEPLKNWHTGNVTEMSSMFYCCNKVSSIEPLRNWNTSNVTSMNGMFGECSRLTDLSPLSGWNTSNVTGMSSMFYNCYNVLVCQ